MRTALPISLMLFAFTFGAQAQEATAKPRVVELTLRDDPAEEPGISNPFGPTHRNFRAQLDLLRKLAADPSVAGVRLVVKGIPDYARSLDLLEELRGVKRAGKKIACYAEMLSQRELVFASLADELCVPPSGLIVLEGIAAEAMYVKDLLAKIDVSVEVLHVGDYKTAYEDFSRSAMSDEQREVIGLLLDEFYGQMLDTIAENRGLQRPAVEAFFARVALQPSEAAAGGLISAAEYEDQFDTRLETLFGGPVDLVEDYGDEGKAKLEDMLGNPFAVFGMLPQLLNPPKREAPKEAHVAVVYASGAIASGKSTAGFDGRVTGMGSETIVEALDKAREDENCKAVVLRVNSPGGSALASDMIWRAIERVREKKPVVASMGYVAASGGYWISMGCDAIVAQPSTITGSLGVVSMLPNVSNALKTLGVNVEVVARGPHGDQLSLLRNGPTPILREVIMRMMHEVYAEFLQKASTGRRMSVEQLDQLARGRVWTGRQAAENGLVDQLGGLDDAIALACTMGGGLDPATTPVAEYPDAPNFFEQFEESLEASTATDLALGALAREMGCGELVAAVRSALRPRSAFDADRVQCLLPFSITLR